MKEYKRLTNKNLDEFNPEHDFCIGCKYFGEPNGCNRFNGTCANYDDFNELYNRLAELEDKIENGTLIELPCKVGDNIYYVEKLWQNDWFGKGCFRWEILEYTITGIFIKGNIVVLYVNNDEDIYGREFTMWKKADGTFEFEELVEDYCFFTKAEAEKKLKGLKGKV